MTRETTRATEGGKSSNEEVDLVGLVPLRLAVPTRSRKAAREIADRFEAVAEQSVEWQKIGRSAILWEIGATVQGAAENRAYALAGQMAAAGEQLGLALAAGIEVGMWQSSLASSIDVPVAEMGARAMAEAQSLFVIGGGHALANVAVRALAIDPKLRAQLAQKFKVKAADPFAPFSNDPREWVSINPRTASRIEAVAQSTSSNEVRQLVAPVVNLARDVKWQELLARRGEDFHRWRPQTHGVVGVAHSSPWRRQGRSRTLGIGIVSYEDARDLAKKTSELATEGMLRLAAAMEAFLDRWPVASNRLGGPKYRA